MDLPVLDKDSVEMWLNMIREFLKKFQWLPNSFVLDHFTDSHWAKLPECWRVFLDQLSPTQLSQWILTGTCTFAPISTPQERHPAPLSLQAIRKTAQVLSLSRSYSPCKNPVVQLAATHHNDRASRTKTDPVLEDKLLKLLNRHVKPKKQHEIRHLSGLIQELSRRTGNINNIIDIGSGLGHLCRFLSYGLGFNTVGIDSDSQLGFNAQIFNEKIEKQLKKYINNEQNELSSNERVGDKVECNSGDGVPRKNPSKIEHLNKVLEKDDKISMFDEFGLVGLHGCGDLGGIVVQNFVENPQVKFLAFASCCYMKLNNCYPLSSCLQNNAIDLKYESLELSCHAKEVYMERLNDENQVNKLKTHCFRATLETILRKYGYSREGLGLKTVKNNHLLPFREYALIATKNLPIELTDEDLNSDSIDTMLSEWMQVVYFYTLRVLVAPVIETVVLLDRALFILENGYKCELRPLFDPVKSPRNIVIIGSKS